MSLLKKLVTEFQRRTAFDQWVYTKKAREELKQEYEAMFGDQPVLQPYAEVMLKIKHRNAGYVTGLVRNVQKQSDDSLMASVKITENKARPGTLEAQYQEGKIYSFDVSRLAKISDPEPVEGYKDPLETTAEKYALEEYAEEKGIDLNKHAEPGKLQL